MTKEEALQAIKLLSALESWGFSLKERMPDYLHEDLCRSMALLEMVVLDRVEVQQPQETYTPGTPLLDAFTKDRT
jgi:hypothetical protein